MIDIPNREFRFHSPTVIQFGVGVAQKLGSHAQKLGIGHAFLVTDPGLAETAMIGDAQKSLREAGIDVTLYSEVKLDPDEASIYHGTEAFRRSGADGLVALGGGSAMDSAKAIGVLAAGGGGAILDYVVPPGKKPTPVIAPFICLPTTSGTGSEVTPIAVVTDPEMRQKRTLFHANIAPALALVDPALTVSMPPRLTASTGMDALAHATEALTSLTANPISDAMCLASVELIGRYLVRAVEDGTDMDARTGMSLASLMAGQVFPTSLLHLGHAVGHALGVGYHIAHGLACAVALPAIFDFLRPAIETPLAKIGAALTPGLSSAKGEVGEMAYAAPEIIGQLYQRVELPGLGEAIHVTREDLPDVARLVMREERLISRAAIRPTEEDWVRIFERSL